MPAGTLEAIAAADVFHISGISLAVSASLRETVVDLVRHAQASGTLVSFDVNHRATLWSKAEAHAAFQALMPFVDILFAGDDEAQLMLSADSVVADVAAGGVTAGSAAEISGAMLPRIAREIASLGPATVVLKPGDKGAVVDTVGAGDAFVAGYLSGVITGKPTWESLDRGIRCGAIACASEGDWEGNPTHTELDILLSAGDPVLR